MKNEIATARLTLVPLDPDTVREWIRSGWAAAGARLGLIADEWRIRPDFKSGFAEMAPMLLQRMLGHPTDWRWNSGWLIVLTSERRIIGNIGFNGAPESDGKAFFGYFIDERYQRSGYMTEALGRMVEWAFADPRTKLMTANTFPDNIGSIRVLVKNGFVQDGLYEDVPLYVLSRETWESRTV